MFSYKRPIRLNDTDPAGVIFFARVYDIAHEAFESLLESFEYPIAEIINKSEIIYPLVSSSAKYKAPLRLGDKIDVKLQLDSITNSSFTIEYIFIKNGESCTSVSTTHVSISKKSWEKVGIPEFFRKNLQSLQNM
ncbi:thioesterase family protein [Candidatus Kapabacteria bacterium]|nr:thioesterase family protein [Candidatus Kapabacteria bacterium]